MAEIVRASESDAAILTKIAAKSFMSSHGHSAPQADMEQYIKINFTLEKFEAELKDPKNLYYLILDKEQVQGYSKIILDFPHPEIQIQKTTKLERLYLLPECIGQGMGQALFDFNLSLIRTNQQKGIWLYVWKENETAIAFYQKKGFKIVGSFDFKISETHKNPNHLMFLNFDAAN